MKAAVQALYDYGLEDFILEKWRARLDTAEIAKAVQHVVFAADVEDTVPTISDAQAYAYGVIARHQDALYAARQQEAQRA